MGRFAEDSVYSNAPSPTTGAGLAILASNQRAILELPGAQAPQLVTIADGAITPTGAFLRVDTEGQAAADDLTIINVTISDTESLHDGMIVYLQAADSGRVVTIKNTASAGGITTYDGQDTTLSTDSWLQLQLQGGNWVEMYNQRTGADVPVGSIIWSANATVPAGYLLCNGASVGRDTYPELFAAIGTTYGEGDGSTTFNLPDLIGRFIEGSSTAGTVKEAGLPGITGSNGYSSTTASLTSGAFYNGAQGSGAVNGTNHTFFKTYFDASRSSSIYGNSTTVQPPSVTALPCIKAFSSVIGDATVVAAELVDDIMARTDPAQAAHAAMPSGQYIDLTLPAHQGTVTAPGDGLLAFAAGSASTNAYVGLVNTRTFLRTIEHSTVVGNNPCVYIPCSAGDVIRVIYWNIVQDSNIMFRLIYANGSAPTV